MGRNFMRLVFFFYKYETGKVGDGFIAIDIEVVFCDKIAGKMNFVGISRGSVFRKAKSSLVWKFDKKNI